ncbi:membrane bound O-acyl transferase family-domain-containing protein [Aspergillus pseudoustus]|uniref:Membrane bound O-acyl transferase family-domain-containing protein n=1 Tax=Aspergillus pseudoustus TaxID=1810923 RepID=A0ABR4KM92_9EURO
MADHSFVRYEQILLDTRNRLHSLIQRGDAKPWLLWHALLPMVLPFVALLIPQRKGGLFLRPLLFFATVSIIVEIILYRRALLGANGYMVGLIMAWWLVWSSTLLFFNDVEHDFRRIERIQPVVGKGRTGQNGPSNGEKLRSDMVPADFNSLIWQPYPQSFLHRLGWTLALLLNLRGPDFNFRIPSLDPLPLQLASKHHQTASKNSYPSVRTRLCTAAVWFFVSYLAIDILKLILILDPYFFGAVSAPAPYPFNCLSAVPGLVQTYRYLASGLGVYFALQFVTPLNPLFFLGLATTFPSAAQALTATPLDATWLYTDQFGPFTAILDQGLAGAWSTWWHQMFRFGFISTAKWIISFLPQGISSRRSIRRIITTLVAFSISGMIHALGSYTQLGDTRPLGPFLFFFLQAVGVFVQDTCSRILVSLLTRQRVPPTRWLRRVGNGLFALGWLLLTGRLIADDFAKGGLWLTEPLPVSFVRGLMGRGWLCWRTAWFEYYDDGTFWGSGVRLR